MRVIFLGTSGAIPTGKRALPAVALVREGTIVLFDCGEGTQRQLIRAGLKLTRVRYVLISHLHADHVLGLPGLVISRSFIGGREALDLYGPPGLAAFLRSVLESTGSQIEYALRIHETEGGTAWDHGEFRIIAERLQHRATCLGFALVEHDRSGHFLPELAEQLGVPPGPMYGELKRGASVILPDGRVVRGADLVGPPIPGRKVAYVVDTVPCLQAELLAKDADLLIFESTFAPGAEEEARQYGHLTARQAYEIAVRAGARRLALFHFSSRYQDVVEFREDLPSDGPELILAEDFLEVEIPRREAQHKAPSSGPDDVPR